MRPWKTLVSSWSVLLANHRHLTCSPTRHSLWAIRRFRHLRSGHPALRSFSHSIYASGHTQTLPKHSLEHSGFRLELQAFNSWKPQGETLKGGDMEFRNFLQALNSWKTFQSKSDMLSHSRALSRTRSGRFADFVVIFALLAHSTLDIPSLHTR